MKKSSYLLFAVLAITLLLGGNALAAPVPVNQGDNSYYFVTYYSNANTTGAPDATLRIVNDGDYTGCVPAGESVCEDPTIALYADIYVFDDSEEMQECCSCFVSPDGLLSESVDKNLTANELTGRAENTRGVIKVLSAEGNDPGGPVVVLNPGLRGWMTHIQAGATKTTWSVTETPLADSNLEIDGEGIALVESCSFAITLGSGYGVCSCTPEDHDF